MRYRPMIRVFFFVFIFGCLLLGYCGANEPDAHPFGRAAGVFIDADLDSFVWLSRLGFVLYFQFFVALFFVGLIETPLPTPESISSPVLPQGAAASPEKKG
jgi:ubiquinol-cytochrome c reductase cytochrome b subunit